MVGIRSLIGFGLQAAAFGRSRADLKALATTASD
jgi:hypothetical protein